MLVHRYLSFFAVLFLIAIVIYPLACKTSSRKKGELTDNVDSGKEKDGIEGSDLNKVSGKVGKKLLKDVKSIALRDSGVTPEVELSYFKISNENSSEGYYQPCMETKGGRHAQKIEYHICPKSSGTCDQGKSERSGEYFNQWGKKSSGSPQKHCVPAMDAGDWLAVARACYQKMDDSNSSETEICGSWKTDFYRQQASSNAMALSLHQEEYEVSQQLYEKGKEVHGILTESVKEIGGKMQLSEGADDSKEEEKLEQMIVNQLKVGSTLNGHFFATAGMEDLTKGFDIDEELASQNTLSLTSGSNEKFVFRCRHRKFGELFDYGYSLTAIYSLQRMGIDRDTARSIIYRNYGPERTERYIRRFRSRYIMLIPAIKSQFEVNQYRESLLLSHLYRRGRVPIEVINQKKNTLLTGSDAEVRQLLAAYPVFDSDVNTTIKLKNANIVEIRDTCAKEMGSTTAHTGEKLMVIGGLTALVGMVGLYVVSFIDVYRGLRKEEYSRIGAFLGALFLDEDYIMARNHADWNNQRMARQLSNQDIFIDESVYYKTSDNLMTGYKVFGTALLAGLGVLAVGWLMDKFGLTEEGSGGPTDKLDQLYDEILSLKGEQEKIQAKLASDL